MTNEQISAIINILRCMEKITPLQKDILDTWDTLCKNPFDEDAAKKQILGALGTAARDERARRERIRVRGDRALDLADKRRVAFKYAALPCLGNREKRREEKTRRVFVLGACGF